MRFKISTKFFFSFCFRRHRAVIIVGTFHIKVAQPRLDFTRPRLDSTRPCLDVARPPTQLGIPSGLCQQDFMATSLDFDNSVPILNVYGSLLTARRFQVRLFLQTRQLLELSFSTQHTDNLLIVIRVRLMCAYRSKLSCVLLSAHGSKLSRVLLSAHRSESSYVFTACSQG